MVRKTKDDLGDRGGKGYEWSRLTNWDGRKSKRMDQKNPCGRPLKLKKKNYIMKILIYNCIFVVELLLLYNNMLIAIIIAVYEVLLVDNQ